MNVLIVDDHPIVAEYLRAATGRAMPEASVRTANTLEDALASIIVAWFSRRREFRADAGGANLESAGAMASALNRLKSMRDAPSQLPDNLTAS